MKRNLVKNAAYNRAQQSLASDEEYNNANQDKNSSGPNEYDEMAGNGLILPPKFINQGAQLMNSKDRYRNQNQAHSLQVSDRTKQSKMNISPRQSSVDNTGRDYAAFPVSAASQTRP